MDPALVWVKPISSPSSINSEIVLSVLFQFTHWQVMPFSGQLWRPLMNWLLIQLLPLFCWYSSDKWFYSYADRHSWRHKTNWDFQAMFSLNPSDKLSFRRGESEADRAYVFRFSMTWRWLLELLISGIRRNRISSSSVMTQGSTWGIVIPRSHHKAQRILS